MARLTELAQFYRSLAHLLGAGVPVVRAVESTGLGVRIEHGSTLAEALMRAGSFPPHHVKLIAIAEASGRTESVLMELADFTEQLHAMRRTILTGLILPALVLHAAAFVVPLPSFLLGGSLAGYVLASVGFIAAVWLVVILVVVLGRSASPATLDSILRPLPIFGRTWRELDYWRLVSNMEMLTNAGLGVIPALRLCADTCRSPRTAAVLRQAADAAELRGEPVSTALERAREFPPEMTAMWATGEQSGRLDDIFQRLAVQLADRCRRRMEEVARWTPRLIYAAVCVYLITQILRLAANYVNLLNSI